jgi:hypothetical protein
MNKTTVITYACGVFFLGLGLSIAVGSLAPFFIVVGVGGIFASIVKALIELDS